MAYLVFSGSKAAYLFLVEDPVGSMILRCLRLMLEPEVLATHDWVTIIAHASFVKLVHHK